MWLCQVPRIHAVLLRQMGPQSFVSPLDLGTAPIPELRQRALNLLQSALCGDRLCAEYLLLQLLARCACATGGLTDCEPCSTLPESCTMCAMGEGETVCQDAFWEAINALICISQPATDKCGLVLQGQAARWRSATGQPVPQPDGMPKDIAGWPQPGCQLAGSNGSPGALHVCHAAIAALGKPLTETDAHM